MAKSFAYKAKHRKPGPAAKHVPEGYEQMKNCPMCHGKGKVSTDHDSPGQMALRRSG